VVKVNRVVPVLDNLLIYDIEHLQEGRFWGNVFGRVGVNATFGPRAGLAPNFESEIHG